MITKMPVRLVTLAGMELEDKSVFWDIGACTGSVSIEVRLHHPHIRVIAFEKRAESGEIILRNTRRFKAPGIRLLAGNYLDADKELLPAPDAVFLGGYGGAMEQILDDAARRLKSGGIIAFNSVSGQSRERFLNWAERNTWNICFQQLLTVGGHHPIHVLCLKRNVVETNDHTHEHLDRPFR